MFKYPDFAYSLTFNGQNPVTGNWEWAYDTPLYSFPASQYSSATITGSELKYNAFAQPRVNGSPMRPYNATYDCLGKTASLYFQHEEGNTGELATRNPSGSIKAVGKTVIG